MRTSEPDEEVNIIYRTTGKKVTRVQRRMFIVARGCMAGTFVSARPLHTPDAKALGKQLVSPVASSPSCQKIVKHGCYSSVYL